MLARSDQKRLFADWIWLMYIRFVLMRSIEHTGAREGFFDAAYSLKSSRETPKAVAASVSELLDWFEQNLSTPKRFNRSKSKGFYHRDTKGISWFKPEAHEHISKAFALLEALRDSGLHVEMIKTSRPGYIVYEDNHQIVAEPFSDTKC